MIARLTKADAIVASVRNGVRVSALAWLMACAAALPAAAQTIGTGRVTVASMRGYVSVNLPCFGCGVFKFLTAPGSDSVAQTGTTTEAGTANLTINVVTSAAGEVQRIEFIGSATARAASYDFGNASSTGSVGVQTMELLVAAGPVRATVTEHILKTRGGVIVTDINTSRTMDFPEGPNVVTWLSRCTAFAYPGTIPSEFANCSYTIEFERRPVLIIPGVGATYSADVTSDLTWLIHRGVPPSQLQIDPMTKVYHDLIQTLKNVGYVEGKDLFTVNYDWRLPPGPSDGAFDGRIDGLSAASISDSNYLYAVDYLGETLRQASEQWAIDHPGAAPLDSVDVITHSTGGLVARTYIQSGAAYGGEYVTGKALPRINNLFMIGVPNQGASKAWNPLHDNWVVDPAFQMVLSKIIDRAYQKVLHHGLVISGPDYNISLASISAPQCQDGREVCFIKQYVPTAQALLATYNFIDLGAGLTSVNNNPSARNALLLDLNAGDANAFADPSKVTARPTIIYGTNGDDTPTTAVLQVGPTLTTPGSHPIAEFANFVGRDAGANEIYYSDTKVPNGGDGTVPLISSEGQFLGDSRVTLMPFTKGGNTAADVNHTALPYNTDVQQAILNTLGVCPAPCSKISTGLNSIGLNAATACAAGCSNFGLDPVDGFMVDGQGRRLGFSAATGAVAEIPGSVWFGNSEGMGWVFGPVEEPVALELTGLGQAYDVTASVLSPTRIGGLAAGGFLAQGAPKLLPIPLVDRSSSGTIEDHVAPVTTPAPSPQSNAAGWHNSDVAVALSATDDPGGSGVKNITYSASGAQPIATTTVAGAALTITVAAEGQTIVSFFATDNAGNAEAPQTITINLDKTPPSVSCSVDPGRLWPPDHRLIPVKASVIVTDARSGSAGFILQSIVSNEPDAGGGSGDTANDIQGFVIGTASSTGRLRAERAGSGTGRVYTLTYRVMDAALNPSMCVTNVFVPHNP